MSDQIIIPTEIPTKLFNDHFNIKNNSRIFFSGKFGIGKTTFLKGFLDDDSTLFLKPINYQVSTNEDIFEFIKYDLIFQLFEKNKIEISDDINCEILLYEYLKNNGLNLAYNSTINILSALPKIGVAFKTVKSITKFFENFESFKKEHQNQEKFIIDNFTKTIENQAGSYKEFDLISNLISNTISNEDFTLVIDDLDRLDPDHLFRLLNIFSSHIDIDKNSNKFGFDKIIFVGDINNMESIYHHKYGDKSDSYGYFNKFYSQSIFYFDNNSSLIMRIEEILVIYSEKFNLNKTQIKILKFEITEILIDLIRGEHLTLRRLLNGLNSFSFKDINENYIKFLKTESIRLGYLNIIFVFQILENLFGFEYSNLEKSFANCKPINQNKGIYEMMIDELLVFNEYIEVKDNITQVVKLDNMDIIIKNIKTEFWPTNGREFNIYLEFDDYKQKKELTKNFYKHFAIGFQRYRNF